MERTSSVSRHIIKPIDGAVAEKPSFSLGT